MKQVLITGENSYIGNAVEKWLKREPDKFKVTIISVRSDKWKDLDFSNYDSIFHVAGIAHADTGKLTEEEKKQYYKVNCDLAIEVASKFKKERKKLDSQFIYMSSIIVYDNKTNVGKKRIITPKTKPNPSSFYGDSKLQAELKLSELVSDTFLLAIIRPPMIYGYQSKGNYPLLAKIAKRTFIFPTIKNERSMLHINNLSEFIKLVILNKVSGTLFPQNSEYVRTSDLVKEVAKIHQHKLLFTPLFNWAINLLSFFPGEIGKTINKAFGNLVYEKSMSVEKINSYQIITFEESIKATEKV